MKVDDFIGTTFPTPKGGTITVMSKLPKNKYMINCSICSKDKELYPDGFSIGKSNLKSGAVPCGCARSPRWVEFQYRIRIERECLLRNYKFHGFLTQGVVNNKTKIHLECLKDGCHWKSMNVNGFFTDKGCPDCDRVRLGEATRQPDKYHIDIIRESGVFNDKDIFTRNTVLKDSYGKYPYWDFVCNKCSYDKFVRNGVCTGNFISTRSRLQMGHKPCRCGVNHRWTQGEREFQIKEICDKEGLLFEGWVSEDGYVNSKGSLSWICKNQHRCNTTVDEFVGVGTRCKKCAVQNSSFGLIKGKEQEPDTLYLLEFEDLLTGECFIKVGRTFDRLYKKRLNYFKGFYNVTDLATNHDTHENIVPIEKDYHNFLSEYHYTPKIPFGGSVLECFTIEALDLLDY